MDKLKKFASISAVFLFFILPLFAFGQGINDFSGNPGGNSSDERSYLPIVQCGPGSGKDCDLCELFKTVERIIKFFMFAITPPLAALLIAIGGAMMIISYFQGSDGGVNKARKLFGAVAIGLLIIYGAWLIVNTFFWLIGVSGWTGLENGWWSLSCN